MRNTDSGMTLIETVTALSILTVVVSVIIPIYEVISLEKQSIIEERRALFFLEKYSLSAWDSSSVEKTIHEQVDDYLITSNAKQDGVEMCIQWEGGNKRKYEKCLFVLPKPIRNDIN